MTLEFLEVMDLTETCPDCGCETGMGPCACGVDAPERLSFVGQECVGTVTVEKRPRLTEKRSEQRANGIGGMRMMVARKLAAKGEK